MSTRIPIFIHSFFLLLVLTVDFRLIVVAIFCLCIAHPGFIFNRKAKVYYSVATGAAGSDDSAYRSKLSEPVKEPMRQYDTYGA